MLHQQSHQRWRAQQVGFADEHEHWYPYGLQARERHRVPRLLRWPLRPLWTAARAQSQSSGVCPPGWCHGRKARVRATRSAASEFPVAGAAAAPPGRQGPGRRRYCWQPRDCGPAPDAPPRSLARRSHRRQSPRRGSGQGPDDPPDRGGRRSRSRAVPRSGQAVSDPNPVDHRECTGSRPP